MTPRVISVDAASAAVKGMQLRDLKLMRLNAVAHGEAPAGTPLSWDMRRVPVTWAEHEPGKVVARAEFSFKIETKEQIWAEIDATWLIDYAKTDVGLSDEQLDSFCGLHAFLHAWPYARVLVQDFSSRLGFPALVLPLVIAPAVVELVDVHRLEDEAGTTPEVTPQGTPTRRRREQPSKKRRGKATP